MLKQPPPVAKENPKTRQLITLILTLKTLTQPTQRAENICQNDRIIH